MDNWILEMGTLIRGWEEDAVTQQMETRGRESCGVLSVVQDEGRLYRT